jgi:hypothetical protein
MLKSQKSEVTCSYCSSIFKDPIDLPCGDSICREHFSERDVVKEKRIKCKKCNGEYQVKDNEFKSNNQFKNSIESHSYLSDEELRLKQDLEQSIRQFFEFYDEFIQNRTKIDMDVFNHFQELRFQIDEHRERLKAKIDDVALEMIEQTKKCEAEYLKSLKENLLSSSFDHSKSLESELNHTEDTFRNPNLLVQSIKEMQSKLEESLKEIQVK